MKILITAGPVYGRLDDNKLVSNRTRGIWASEFAAYLARRGHAVTLLVPDTIPIGKVIASTGLNVTVVQHGGYEQYAEICEQHAPQVDAAVMAAAVVNWIPAEPVRGKMKTDGYKEGDIIQVPFVLAPRVINRMRKLNPKLTLVGCKMLSGSTEGDLVRAAEHVLAQSKAHVVLANDLQDLKHKMLVFPDGAILHFRDEFDAMFSELELIITDKHFSTQGGRYSVDPAEVERGRAVFSRIADKYRPHFCPRDDGRVFGAVAVPIRGGWLVSPRTKKADFTGADAVVVTNVDFEQMKVATVSGKASMNAPLLIRFGENRAPWLPILHLHEFLPGVRSRPYAPPGTARDTFRGIDSPMLNIDSHGFVAALDPSRDFEIYGR